MYLIGYGMLAVAIENNPKVAEYGYLIIKRYTIITNDIKTVRDDLSSLKEKTNDRAKTIIDKYLVGLQKLGLDNSYNIKNVWGKNLHADLLLIPQIWSKITQQQCGILKKRKTDLWNYQQIMRAMSAFAVAATGQKTAKIAKNWKLNKWQSTT